VLAHAYFGREKHSFEHTPYVEEKKHVEDEGKTTCGR